MSYFSKSSVNYSISIDDRLQNSVGGGKPKMRQYFNIEVKCWPSTMRPYKAAPQTARDKDKLIDRLQDVKNKFYLEQLSDSAQTRPGVLQLMDAAFADPDVKVSEGECTH